MRQHLRIREEMIVCTAGSDCAYNPSQEAYMRRHAAVRRCRSLRKQERLGNANPSRSVLKANIREALALGLEARLEGRLELVAVQVLPNED
mmetsp:Transcript_27539/g.68463  ORF Transcript_27539/g.68463 Transcript_27539/m.68463 type:complete len:91 (-) Transcript_27539:969-1241(-)